MTSPQSTTLTFGEMRKAIRRELAFSVDATLSTQDESRVERILKEAISEMVVAKHNWTWLSQALEFTTASGQRAYALPWYFGGLAQITYTPSSSSPCLSVQLIDTELMDRLDQESPTASGDPTKATVRINSAHSAWEIVFWPTPNAARAMTARIRSVFRSPGGDDDSFYAGSQYDPLLLQACRYTARMDRRIEDARDRERYQAALADAIRIDRNSRPALLGTLGINGDNELLGSERPLYYDDQLIV